MKKFLKTLAKKSMSLFMACVMLMSCWVFFAPEKAEAASNDISSILTAAQITAFEQYVGSTAGYAKLTPVQPNAFSDSEADYNASKNTVYNNVLHSDSSASVAVDKEIADIESLTINFPKNTVLMYDGTTTPTFGLAMQIDTNQGGKQVVHYATQIWSNNNYTGNGLAFTGNWHGITEAGTQKSPKFFAPYNAGTNKGGTDVSSTTRTNDTKYEYGDYANVVKYNGNMKDSSGNVIYKEVFTPSFKMDYHGYVNDCDNTNKAYENQELGASSFSVAVINVEGWKNAVYEAAEVYKEILNNPKRENGFTSTSVDNFKMYAKSLLSGSPNKYTWSDISTDATNYETNVKTALAQWAKFTGLVPIYDITWNNYDGELLEKDPGVVKGTTPTYDGSTPTRPATAQYTYTFTGWTPAVTAATKDQVYTATFNSTVNKYTVTFKDYTGAVMTSEKYDYGTKVDAITFPSHTNEAYDDNLHYTYSWSHSISDEGITGDVTIRENRTSGAHKMEIYDEDDVYHYSKCADCARELTEKHVIVRSNTLPTCTTPGKVVETCQAAGCSYSKTTDGKNFINGQLVDAPASHIWDSLPTYKDENTHGIRCVRMDKNGDYACDAWKDGSVVAHDCNLLLRTITPATCVSDGLGIFRCECSADITKEAAIVSDGTEHNFTGAVNKSEVTGAGHNYACVNECGAFGTNLNGEDSYEVHSEKIEQISGNNAKHNIVCEICDYSRQVNHDFVATTTDSSCTTGGTIHKVCKDCGYEYTETIAVKPHTLESFAAVAPDCENDGTTAYYKCSVCLKLFEDADGKKEITEADIIVPAKGHDFTGAIHNRKDGTHDYACANECGAYGIVDAEGNDIKDGYENCNLPETYEVDAENGEHYRSCDKCGYEERAKHVESDSWLPDVADGTPNGTHSMKCTVCGEKFETVKCIYSGVSTDPTCTEDGYIVYTCDTCAHTYTEVLEGTKTGHFFEGAYKFYENNEHNRKCLYCDAHGIGVGADAVVDATEACDFGDWVQVPGKDKHARVCVCGNKETAACYGGTAYCHIQAICEGCKKYYGLKNPSQHFETTKVNGIKATCSTTGYTDYEYCVECQTKLGYETLYIDDNAHKWSETVTTSGDGRHYYSCAYNAEHKKYEDCVAAEETVTVKPTCTTDGYTRYSCTKCSYTWQDDIVPATDHAYGDWEYYKHETGDYHVRVCANDNSHYLYEACYDEEPVVKEPTCDEGGITTHVCDVCAHTWTTDATTKLEHLFTEKIPDKDHLKTPATCTEAAVYYFDCIHPGCNVKSEDLTYTNGAPNGHTWDGNDPEKAGEPINEASCTQNAKYYVYCSVCGITSKGTEAQATFEVEDTMSSHEWKKVKQEAYLKSEAECGIDAVYYYACEKCDASSEKLTGLTWTDEGSALKHEFTDDSNKTVAYRKNRATCTTKETYYYACEACGINAKLLSAEEAAEYTNLTYEVGDVDLTNHPTDKIKVIEKLEATCTDDGYYAYNFCEECNNPTEEPTVIPKKGHDFSGDYAIYDEDYSEAATTAEGDKYHNRKCVRCDLYGMGSGKSAEVNKRVKCEYGEWIQDAEKTDGKDTHTRSCVCGLYTETANCHGNEEDANCVTKAVCVDCNTEYGTTSGHSYPDESVNANWTSVGDGRHVMLCANCNTPKYADCTTSNPADSCGETNVCDICGGEYGSEITHKFTNYVSDENATCTEDGTETATCDNCGKETHTRVDIGSRLGHKMSDYVVTKEPTCKDEGEKTSKCTNLGCDVTDVQTIPADKTKHEEGEPQADSTSVDCTNGITFTVYCKICGDFMRDYQVVGKHEFKKVQTKYPTCLDDGFEVYVCTVCEYEDIRYPAELKALGEHTWDEANPVIEKAATCNNEGRGHYECTKCDAISDDFEIEKELHGPEHDVDLNGDGKLDNTIVVEPVAPTCHSRGHNGYWKCLKCSYDEHLDPNSDFVVFEMLEHEDLDGDGKCDDCKGAMYDNNEACGCMCHSDNWLMQLFYKIAKFFWKITGTKKTCNCGAVHY